MGRSRGLLLAIGQASTRIWLRAAGVNGRHDRAEVTARFNRLASDVEWPTARRLRWHLALSVLPGAAMYHALREGGRSDAETVRLVTKALAAMARPRARAYGALSQSAAGRDLFMRAAGSGLRAFPEPGWQARWVTRGPGLVAFDMTRCFDLDMLRRLDAGPIAPAYCAVDDVLYARLDPRLRFTRSATLATGGHRCDFCFERLAADAGAARDPLMEAVTTLSRPQHERPTGALTWPAVRTPAAPGP
jgi:hypothetical protein